MNETPSPDNAVLFPIALARGATKRLPLRLTQRGQPVPLAGYTAKLQVRENAQSDVALIDLSTENGGIAIDGAAGTITLIFAAGVTAGYALPGEYDLMLYAPDGDATRVIYGPVTPFRTVTRP